LLLTDRSSELRPAMNSLYDLTLEQLRGALQEAGVSANHATAVFRRVHQDKDAKLEPPAEKWLAGQSLPELTEQRCTPSADGWTQKYLLGMADGQEIESVLMGFEGRHTACISSQVGCAMGCVFCATGQMGFRRHLTTGEIVGQVHFLNGKLAEQGKDPIRNIVMMGMGEPLHNFDSLMDGMEILTDTCGLRLGHSHISISTVGHVPGILKLAEVERNYSLSVSLHGASDEERGALIPVNRRWPLAELMAACRTYSEKRGQKVLIAWTLIKGVNDSDDHARRLGLLLKGMNVHVNLIPLNPTEGYEEEPPEEERVSAFHAIVKEAGGIPATVRQRRGIDVGAGCGQLASSK